MLSEILQRNFSIKGSLVSLTYKIGAFYTVHRDSTWVNQYIDRCTKIAPFKAIEWGGNKPQVYCENFPQAISLRFGDMKHISEAKLRAQGKDSLVTLRTYECVIVSAVLSSTDSKILAMYHYFRDQDPDFVGVDDFNRTLLNEMRTYKITPADVQIVLASSFLSDALVDIATKIHQAGLPIRAIHTKKIIVLQPGREYVSELEKELPFESLIASIGVSIHLDKGIEVFLD